MAIPAPQPLHNRQQSACRQYSRTNGLLVTKVMSLCGERSKAVTGSVSIEPDNVDDHTARAEEAVLSTSSQSCQPCAAALLHMVTRAMHIHPHSTLRSPAGAAATQPCAAQLAADSSMSSKAVSEVGTWGCCKLLQRNLHKQCISDPTTITFRLSGRHRLGDG